jgi:putative flippase GtrA
VSKTLLRSALIGLAATAADLLALFALVEVLGLPAPVANVPALLVGITVQFFGNKHFAFRDPSRDYLRQGALFGLVELGALLLNAVVFHLLVTGTPVPYWLARALGSAGVYFGFSYPLWRHVFR